MHTMACVAYIDMAKDPSFLRPSRSVRKVDCERQSGPDGVPSMAEWEITQLQKLKGMYVECSKHKGDAGTLASLGARAHAGCSKGIAASGGLGFLRFHASLRLDPCFFPLSWPQEKCPPSLTLSVLLQPLHPKVLPGCKAIVAFASPSLRLETSRCSLFPSKEELLLMGSLTTLN